MAQERKKLAITSAGKNRLGVGMSNKAETSHGVMEGAGFYNRYAQLQAAGASLAAPFLEQAILDVALDAGDHPIVVADYGSSQGKNSMAPMQTAIKGLRKRVGQERPILVVHIDQPANDFNTLFDVLHRDPGRYSLGDANVFPSAIGRSFYENVFPKEHVHLAWSSYAAVWLSRIPMLIPNHFVALACSGAVREAFDLQAAEDWKLFLSLRARELRAGGRLLIVLPALSDDGVAGFEPLFAHANDVLAEMVADGTITAEDRSRMVLGTHVRRRSHLLAPFDTDHQFCGLTAECCELFELPDGAWIDYERDGNMEELLNRHTGFFRAIFVPSLATALADPGKTQTFADELQRRLKRKLAERPAPLHSFVQTMVLAKQR
jgi:hypothetical protein